MTDEERAGGKILLQREGPVATVTLNHPEKMNAIELEMWAEIARMMLELDAEESVRAVVFRGAGDRAFSAGADISRFEKERSDSARAQTYAEGFLGGLDAVDAFSKPTLCLIRGACVGGGAELAAAADLRISGESGRFGVPVAKLGLVAGFSEVRRFVHSIGPARTLDMLLTARLFSAHEMLAAGFLTRVVSDDKVEETVYKTAGCIASLAPLVHRWHKRFVKRVLQDPSLSGLTEADVAEQFACFDTGDFREGAAAFLEKRPPRFEGR